jgi:hypothetical protein
MPALDLITILCLGLMIGNELCVSLFVNPSVTRPNGQRRVRCGLPVIRAG